MFPTHTLFTLLHLLTLIGICRKYAVAVHSGGGSWALLQSSVGISAMHMQLLHNDRVIMFDRTDFGPSNISLSDHQCRFDKNDTASPVDCTAHSVEYNVLRNSVRPLMVQTDVWCSSGAAMPDGGLVQTGGFNDGDRAVRFFSPCRDFSCDWREAPSSLSVRRWYATNHVLPGGGQIIIGGRRQFNYEFYPKPESGKNLYSLPFLSQTNDPNIENNLYPFVFLNVDGFLFIFANNRAILFDYANNAVVRDYPEMPGGDPRSYPSTGSAVLLPLEADGAAAEVMVCGGAPKGSFEEAMKGNFIKALDSCGRIRITDPDPEWVMERMPMNRVMGDMTLLPNGHVLIVNGAGSGSAGWEYGRDPVLEPVIYRPDGETGSRFEVQNPSKVPRMYHSTAALIRDGRVLVGGSNPHPHYNFTGVLHPTELSLEAFSPPYLDPNVAPLKPRIILPHSQSELQYGQNFRVQFMIWSSEIDPSSIKVTMVAPSFTTHSFAMNHRMLILNTRNVTSPGSSWKLETMASAPKTSVLAPPGYYLMFVVHKEIPSEGIWVRLR
uniref:Aldehyde oxidase GLOX n=1 Tax=Kalanchoe fedtschenkoi TaxID=63787 RepID=A0A7N0V547_KALFE